MSIAKTGFAIIGVVTAVNYGIKGYRRYVKAPLEAKLTEIFDEETKDGLTWKAAMNARWESKIVAESAALGQKVYERGIELGLTPEQANVLRDQVAADLLAMAGILDTAATPSES